MRAAVARYAAWEESRAAWAVSHGLGEDDVGMVVGECSAPWDVDVI
jgi:hypothetical protein